MANWLIDQTDLYGIKHALLREARVGDAKLGLIGLDPVTNSKVSLLAGGLTDYIPETKKDPNTGSLLRRFEILIVAPVTVEICRRTIGVQMGEYFFKRISEVPYDGVSTPAQWVFSTAYTGERDPITL